MVQIYEFILRLLLFKLSLFCNFWKVMILLSKSMPCKGKSIIC